MRLLTKIGRICQELSLLSVMLVSSKTLPQLCDAHAFLQSVSPDAGKSCCRAKAWSQPITCRLSVIVPAYNVEQYIERCLVSILQQKTSFDYEVIVVNDGSTDATALLLEQYEEQENVRIIHQENGGLSAARNTGIVHARGEYLCFVDSDDTLPPDALEQMMQAALRENAKLVAGSYEKCLRDGSVKYTTVLGDRKVQGEPLPGFACGKVIHSSVFEHLQFPEGYWFEDSVMAQLIHPLCKGDSYTISHPVYRYYENEAGITARAKGNPKALDSLWITMRLLEERKTFGLGSTEESYAYFLSMVRLTYNRTKHLGVKVAKSVFVLQRMLLMRYYSDFQMEKDSHKRKIQDALRKNDFKKYILICTLK